MNKRLQEALWSLEVSKDQSLDRRSIAQLQALKTKGKKVMGAFLWGDPDQDQRSEITWIMVDQMNRWILVQSGFIGSFDLQWSEWFPITDPDPDHPKGTSAPYVTNNLIKLQKSEICQLKFVQKEILSHCFQFSFKMKIRSLKLLYSQGLFWR